MILNKKISIINNDAYEIGHTKNFIVINDNYSGINLYDCKLKYIKTLKFPKKIYIYQIYTSVLDDYLVVLDAENTTLYIVNLAIEKSTIIEKKCKEIFFSYYKANQNDFWLTDSKCLYNFSYKDAALIQKIPANGEDKILAQHANEMIFLDEFENVMYCKDNTKILVSKNYSGNEFFSVYDSKIVKYTENSIFIYRCSNNNELLTQNSVTIEKEFSIRKVCINENKIFVLSCYKGNVKICNIKEYYVE